MLFGAIFSFSAISARHVTDGLSNTVAIGEKHLPPVPDNAPTDQEHYLQGDTAFFAGDQREAVLRAATGGLAASEHDLSREKFGSDHPDVVQVVFADGHVQSLVTSVGEDVLLKLCTIGDSRVVSSDQL